MHREDNTVARNLRLYRSWRSKSIEQTARELKISSTRYKNYETGVWHVPEEIVNRACKLYNIPKKMMYRIEPVNPAAS